MTTTKTKKTNKGEQVGTKHVEDLVRTYKTERWVQNTERLGKVDSLSTWYGLDELSSFLDLARNHQADGIKMYYGVYPDNYLKVPEFAGRQTVVLVATRKKETPYGIVNKNIYINRGGESQILAFNAGETCPPFCSSWPGPFDVEENFGIEMEKIGITIFEQDGKIKIA